MKYKELYEAIRLREKLESLFKARGELARGKHKVWIRYDDGTLEGDSRYVEVPLQVLFGVGGGERCFHTWMDATPEIVAWAVAKLDSEITEVRNKLTKLGVEEDDNDNSSEGCP